MSKIETIIAKNFIKRLADAAFRETSSLGPSAATVDEYLTEYAAQIDEKDCEFMVRFADEIKMPVPSFIRAMAQTR